MNFKKITLLALVLGLLLLSACGPKPIRTHQAQLDTPEHHVSNGNKFLKAGKIDEADRSFTLAKELDPKYSPAYVGLGLVAASRNDFKAAEKNFDQADQYADGKTQSLNLYVGYIRYYTMGGKKVHKKWLKKAEKYFKKARKINKDQPDAYYYMGLAYKKASDFGAAKDKFAKVMKISGEFLEEAKNEYENVQNIESASEGSKLARRIAQLPEINRGDAAALFIEELKVDQIFERKSVRKFDPSYKGPGKKFVTGVYLKAPAATDINDDVLKADIDKFIELGIQGLEPMPDHTFMPNRPLTRVEFAMLIQDILIKINRDESLATRFIGSKSPFPDLRSDQYFFTAVMVCTTRGIMKARDFGTGEFQAMGIVSGAESLLSIRELKVLLQNY